MEHGERDLLTPRKEGSERGAYGKEKQLRL